MVLKYYRIKDYNVWAQAGWDEQGLPVEVEVEKNLDVKHKKEIGERIGYENFIKKAYEKGLLYEGYKVLPYCPRCETVLSDAEVDQGYQEKISPSIYVKFKLVEEPNTHLIIWTTTPWTLIDNEAVAVNPNGVYCKVKVDNESWWIAEPRLEDVLKLANIDKWKCLEKVKGSELKGLKYEHPFIEEVPLHKAHRNAHYVIEAEFVSLNEGTGLVHIAPGHGPEDYEAGVKYNLPITSNVEINGVFNERAGLFKGLYVDAASKKAIDLLRRKGALVYEGSIKHQYPHCWRCHTPLIYRAGRQWFLKVTAIKDDLIKALNEVEIYPPKLKLRFINWVLNAKDWTISRSRIWGTPLPVWRCKDNSSKILVIGSVDELKSLASYLPGVNDDKLVHRPWIDRVKIKANGCSEWIREPFVIDVWIDSGIAWLASINGLQNKSLLSKLVPYKFITEGIDQTRGWFYSLLVTSVVLTGKAPYQNILMQGLVLDRFGRKMAKHLGNVIWAKDALNRYSVDQLRLYILSTYPPGEPFIFNLEELKEPLSKLNIIWNIFRFAMTYMELDSFDPLRHRLEKLIHKSRKEDLWLLSRVNSLQERYEKYMKNYDLHLATRAVIDYFVEDLSHFYVRLIRPRVWKEEGEDKYSAYAALYYSLKKGLQMLAPIVPHFAEYLWQRFVKKFEPYEAESVHLSTIKSVDKELINEGLERTFEVSAKAVSFLSSLRNTANIKLRWPLREGYLAPKDPSMMEYLKEGIEVIKFLSNLKNLYLRSGAPDECSTGEYVKGETEDFYGCIPAKLDEKTYMEALAKELIRRIQVMRNRANLRVDEYIKVFIESQDKDIIRAINSLRDYIANEVRAKELKKEEAPSDALSLEWNIEGKKVKIGIMRC